MSLTVFSNAFLMLESTSYWLQKGVEELMNHFGSRHCLLMSEQNMLGDLGEVTEVLWL